MRSKSKPQTYVTSLTAILLLLFAASPVIAVTCYQKDKVTAAVANGQDCVGHYSPPPEPHLESCEGGCWKEFWQVEECEDDTDVFSCKYCDASQAQVQGIGEYGDCFPSGEVCDCDTDPNNAVWIQVTSTVVETGTDCEMCPERT